MAERVDELARAPSLGKINLIIILIIGFLLFLLVVIVLGLSVPYWVYGLAILAIIIAAAVTLYTNRSRQPQPGQTQARQSRDYLGWIKTKAGRLVPAGIAALAIGSMLYFGIFEVSDKSFSASELNNFSKNCQLQDDELVCSGPWKIFIPNEKNIGKLTVVPGIVPFTAMNIEAGPYLVEYSQVEFKKTGFTNCGYASNGTYYHQAKMYYKHKGEYLGAVQACNLVPVPEGAAPENLYVGTSWLRLLLPGGEDPQVYIDWDLLAASSINIDRQILLGGDITLSSQQSARIKKLNLVFSLYR